MAYQTVQKNRFCHDVVFLLLQSCQVDLVKDGGHKYFLSVLADQFMPVSTAVKPLQFQIEPPRDQTNKMIYAPAKT